MESCSITTPFGTCDGARTCQGATGWGSCDPPSSTDVPDATYTDDNCDGIDGDYDAGIFVSRNQGADSSGCGLVHTDPCATIGQGLIRAITTGRNYVYVQASATDYGEIVSMVVGKHIYGGYDANWVRGPYTDPAHRVRISGGLDTATNQYMTLKAHNLVAPTTVADLYIVGPDASGATADGARSSYAVHVDGGNLTLERVTVIAGNGASGSGGSTGMPTASAAYSSAMQGKSGGAAAQLASACNTSSAGAGGGRGINSCSAGNAPNGGGGGKGGPIDTSCTAGQCAVAGNCDAQSGDPGSPADLWNGSYGYGGSGGAGKSTCGAGNSGGSGYTTNGASGQGGGGGGFLSGSYWYAFSGSGGSTGDNGTGGGGGGGSGGCDVGTDSYGAGGGGGGAGGCRATSGGGGGVGGGGSFGIFAVDSTVTASSCSIQRGNGGAGGDGGAGGHGQQGGPGGPGGPAGDDSKKGGDGGHGAHGGHGGGGGGGAGGISAGVCYYNSTVNQSCTITGGAAGTRGTGGISAPNAPLADRDGKNGGNGTTGSLDSTHVCNNPAGC